jgi:hypothetical protein
MKYSITCEINSCKLNIKNFDKYNVMINPIVPGLFGSFVPQAITQEWLMLNLVWILYI